MQQKIGLEPEDQLRHVHSYYLHKAQKYSKLFHPNSYVVQAVHSSNVCCVNMHSFEDIPPQDFSIFSTVYFKFQQPQLKGNY